jgi:competence ComEA-like helix-hairpin-helix protein|tara:strand:- start:1750 stop:2820 length:1071 start_codon:yes stop_codon:yes gene_type:complete
MKNKLSYSPSQRRGIIFMFLIIGGYFIYLFYIQSYNSELSTIEVTESSSISKKEIKEFEIQIPDIKNPNSWDYNDWTLLGFSNKQIRIINNYKLKLDSFTSKKQLFSCFAFNINHKKMLDTIVDFPKPPNPIVEKINLKSFLFIVSELTPNYDLNKSFDTIYYQQKDGRFFYYLLNNFKNKKQLKSSNWWSYKYPKVVNLDINMLKIIISNKAQEKKQILRIKNNSILNINLSDTSQWKRLKGIGSKRAIRVVKYRNLLGGFNNVEQLKEVYSISDSLYDSLSKFLYIKDSSINQINVNTCSVNQLKKHPYIKWNIANSIVSYRKQHGTYKSLNELLKIHIIDDELYIKIVSYLTI